MCSFPRERSSNKVFVAIDFSKCACSDSSRCVCSDYSNNCLWNECGIICGAFDAVVMASHFSWPGAGAQLQSSGMLTKDQLLQLFRDFATVLALPETKSRLAGCIRDMQEAVNVTTEIQEELFLNMGVDPKFGIESLGKVNTVYADDRDLMIQFYQFVSGEEMACEEAELGPEAFARKMEEVKKSQQQQMGMLRQLRSVSLDEQQAFFQGLQAKLHEAQIEGGAPMTSQEIQEFFEDYGLEPNAS